MALSIRREVGQTADVARDPRDVERIAQLESKLDAALKRIEELEEQLRGSSRTSSKAPSSDPPSATRHPKTPTGRQPGGQPGHKRHTRAWFPSDTVRPVPDSKPAPAS